MDILRSRSLGHPGALTPCAHFPSPLHLSPAVVPITPPSRHSLSYKDTLCSRPPATRAPPLLLPSHAQATCFCTSAPSVIRRVASCLPCDCTPSLQSTGWPSKPVSALFHAGFNYISQGDLNLQPWRGVLLLSLSLLGEPPPAPRAHTIKFSYSL